MPKISRTVLRVVAVVVILGSVVSRAGAAAPAPEGRNASLGALQGTVLYSQPVSPAGGSLLLSSLKDPDGSGSDQWIWDGFKLTWTGDITEIRWTGAYDPNLFGSGGPVNRFVVSIYASGAGMTQPDVAHPALVTYELPGNAGETPGSMIGTLQTYDYSFALPAAFHAQGGIKYWVQIEAYQGKAPPDWGFVRATGGDGTHFRAILSRTQFQTVSGDTAFSLLGSQVALLKVYLPVVLR